MLGGVKSSNQKIKGFYYKSVTFEIIDSLINILQFFYSIFFFRLLIWLAFVRSCWSNLHDKRHKMITVSYSISIECLI